MKTAVKGRDPIGPVDPSLVKLGFSRIKPNRIKRIGMEVSGDTKCGKTHLIMTMTEPIAIINFDRSLQDILPEFPGVDLIVKDFSDMYGEIEDSTNPQARMTKAKAAEAQFAAALKGLFEHRHVRSIAVDKGTTLWELIRVAEWGNISNIKAHHYVPVNARMRAYMSMYMAHDKNFLVTHDTKEEWVNEKPTGRQLVDGFKYTSSLMQVNASMWRDKDGDRDFKMEITGCGTNAELVGWEFVGADVNWKKIAPMVLDDTVAADWK